MRFGDLTKKQRRSGENLASMCSTINFKMLLLSHPRMEDNRDEIPIGYLDKILMKEHCTYCRLLLHKFASTRVSISCQQSEGIPISNVICSGLLQRSVQYLLSCGVVSCSAIWFVTIPPLPKCLASQSRFQTSSNVKYATSTYYVTMEHALN